MSWKYAGRECRIHVVMSVLCLVQAVFLFAIVTGLLSIFMERYDGYQPVRDLVEQDGFVCNLVSSVHLDGDAEGRPVQSAEAYEQMLQDADVYGQYAVNAFVGDSAAVDKKREEGVYYQNVRAYDDGWIRGFAPQMDSGSWLKTENAEPDQLEAVVLQSSDIYQTGDVVYLDNNSETELQTKIPVKIVGIIDRNSDIIYQSNRSGAVDYRLLFSNMVRETEDLDRLSYTENTGNYEPETFFVSKRNLDSVQEAYAEREAEENLSENYETVLHTEKTIFTTTLRGVVIIAVRPGSSQELLAYDKNRIAQISQFSFLHDLEYIRANTWKNIMANISDLLPVGGGMVLFTLISFVTLSTLMYQKNMRKYSVYYLYGLTWRRIFRIHMLYISMIAVAALALGVALVYGVGQLGFRKEAAVQLGVVQLGGCLAVLLVLLLSASLMCLSMVRGRSAKEILQEVN